MKKTIAILCCALSVPAWSMYVFDPQNFVKNALAAKTAVESLEVQANMLKNRTESLKLEIQNSEKVSDFQWREMSQILQQIGDISQRGQSISYSMNELDAQFQKRYPNYQHPAANYRDAYQMWNITTLNTLQNSLSSIGLTMNQLNNEEKTLRAIQAQSQSAAGQTQVLQVTNELASEQVRQLQSLKQVMAAQSNAHTAYMAHQVSKQSNRDAEMQLILNNIPDKYEENSKGFGKIQVR